MQTRTTTRALTALAAMLVAPVLRAEVIDRLAVTVGTHIVAQSEILSDLRVSAFIDGTKPDLSSDAKRRAADRLVDQHLVLQDAALARAPLPQAADVAPLLAPIRARYASDADFASALSRAGITETDLREHLLAGLQMMRYSDLRFRPEVLISEPELQDYYNQLKPKLGANPPSFEDAREEVERLLTGERTLQAMDRWLGMTRSETTILYHEEAFQ